MMVGEKKTPRGSRKLVVSFPSYKNDPKVESLRAISATVEAADSPARLSPTDSSTQEEKLRRRNTVIIEPRVAYTTHVYTKFTHVLN